MPKEKLPLDEQFIENFTNQGGRFLYCSNDDEVKQSFNSILREHDFHNSEAFCLKDELVERFQNFPVRFSKYNLNSAFFLTSCEYVISDTGAILFSSNQVKEFKPSELPHTYIVISRASQIVSSISEGLTGIKLRSGKNIPSNITTLKSFDDGKKVEEKNLMNYGVPVKRLYLILQEDL
jgi:L-lactate utilization protein LutC